MSHYSDLTGANPIDVGKMKTAVFDVIHNTEKAGSKTRFISSDMGGDNQRLWKELGVGVDKPYFKNPVDKTRNIYVFADVQHVFKNITQAFIIKDKIIIPKDIQLKFSLPTNEASINHVKELFNIEEGAIFKLTPKLKHFMFHANNFQKMRVKNSYYLMSFEVASALKLLTEVDASKEAFKTTAWLIQQIAYWHKIMTSRTADLAISKFQPQKFEETWSFLEEMIVLFKGMRYQKEGTLSKLPSQNGAIMSTISLLCLSKELFDEGFKFILSSRFSTDAVENLFSVVRLSNSKPDAVQFKNILR